MPNTIIMLYVRGDMVERPSGRGTAKSPLTYRWRVGYHPTWINPEGKLARLWPAMTRSECIADAARHQRRAKFVTYLTDETGVSCRRD